MTMTEFLKNNGYTKVTSTSSYVIAEGEEPICLIAHLDTIAELLKQNIDIVLYDEVEDIMHAIGGKCFDDRAGVFAIIEIIKDGYRPSVIFTTDEESGGIGATELVANFPKCPFKSIKALIELDRAGSNDCVFYDCDNKDFIKYIEKYGFKEAIGSFSDISIIAPEWGIAAVNLSIGYYNEHTPMEYLVVNELTYTIAAVEHIIDDNQLMPFFEYIEKEELFWGFTRCASKNTKVKCVICEKNFSKGYSFTNASFRFINSYDVCANCTSKFFNKGDDGYYRWNKNIIN